MIDDVTLAEVKPNEWFETVGVEGRNVKVKVDTGASCNVMSMNTYQALASDRLVKAKTRLESYGGHRLSVVGKWCCVAVYDNKLYPLDFIVVKEMANTLLGLQSCVDFGIVKPSPAVLLQGRNLRSGLHCHSESLTPKVVSPQHVKR